MPKSPAGPRPSGHATRPRHKLVRCLGPAPREHTFLSAHPSERVCQRCRELQRQLSVRAVAAPVFGCTEPPP